MTDADGHAFISEVRTNVDNDVRWIATLSSGETAVEHSGEYQIIPGERKPWVRLCNFLEAENLHLTSLRVNFKGRTIHLPREKFTRFGFDEHTKAPNFYSLQYHLEVDDVINAASEADFFIDLAAHFDDFVVHYVQDISQGANSWVVVTESREALAASPPKKT